MFYLIAFTTGLVSSLHCVGMCGPLALALPVGGLSRQKGLLAKIGYNLGRISTYAFLGLIFGLIGKQVFLFNIQQKLAIFLGIFILGFTFRKSLTNSIQLDFIHQFLRNRFKNIFASKSLKNFYFLGIINGFLPCAMIYLALSGAVVSASPIGGMIYMALFGLGTSPAMFFLLRFVNLIKNRNSIFLRKLTSAYTIIFAGLLIIRGLNLGIPYLSPQVLENADKPITVCHGK